jgi:fructose-bisphosphate aldolase, class II
MPIATPEVYAEMLDRAKVGAFAYPAYEGVLKVDGGVGDKKAYDPRTWGKAAEQSMAARVVQACQDLRSAGTSLSARA